MRSQAPNVFLVVGSLALLLLSGAQEAIATDTVHLKNGRVIRTEQARVEGDQLVFLQFGSEMRIPMALVKEIVREEATDDTVVEAPATPTPTRPAAPAASDAPGPIGEVAGEGSGDEKDPKESAEYWSQKITAIDQEKAALAARLTSLRREERAFLFSHKSTSETKRKIDAVIDRQSELDKELADLRREARRLAIPPGWLRGQN